MVLDMGLEEAWVAVHSDLLQHLPWQLLLKLLRSARQTGHCFGLDNACVQWDLWVVGKSVACSYIRTNMQVANSVTCCLLYGKLNAPLV